MFTFIKNALKKVYTQCTSQLGALFARSKLDQATLDELKALLIGADVGIQATKSIMAALQDQYTQGSLTRGQDLAQALEQQLLSLLGNKQLPDNPVTLMVGINGSGKTTFAAKLAHRYQAQGHRVLLVAADTFRAAAVQQLVAWGQTIGVEVVSGKPGQDPAAVVFTGCERFVAGNFDRLIIDTAGRLQTKINLMNELAKIRRIIARQLPDVAVQTLLTVDAMLGQNSFEQARVFHEATTVDGIVLTKMDGTGKGGVVFAINQQLGIPVAYLSFGESVSDCAPFDPQAYVRELVGG